MDLTDRKKRILKAVVEDYIRTAEPVGSKAIAQEMGGSVSSATIRNELSDLSDMGYLEQPHTSAGRVPSPAGYRLYIDELMQDYRLSTDEAKSINQAMELKMQEVDKVVSQVGKLVSQMTNLPAYAMAARAAGSCVFSASVGYLIYQKSPLVQLFGAAWEKNLDRKMGRQRPFIRTEQGGVPLEGHHGRSGVWSGEGEGLGRRNICIAGAWGAGRRGTGGPPRFLMTGPDAGGPGRGKPALPPRGPVPGSSARGFGGTAGGGRDGDSPPLFVGVRLRHIHHLAGEGKVEAGGVFAAGLKYGALGRA